MNMAAPTKGFGNATAKQAATSQQRRCAKNNAVVVKKRSPAMKFMQAKAGRPSATKARKMTRYLQDRPAADTRTAPPCRWPPLSARSSSRLDEH